MRPSEHRQLWLTLSFLAFGLTPPISHSNQSCFANEKGNASPSVPHAVRKSDKPVNPNQSPEETKILPAGITDSSGRVGYFAGANGSIEAFDLATGKVLWMTHEAQRPLLIDGNHLLVQAGVKRNRIRILALDRTRQGECELECDPIVFPAWVVTGAAHGRSFAAHWQLEKHKLRLEWEARAWFVGKTRPSAEQEVAARKHATGLVRVDLRTGQVEVSGPEAKTTTEHITLPDYLERKSLRWHGIVGSDIKALELQEENGQQRLILHSWDRINQKVQLEKELLRGKHLLARASLDESVLCLYEACPNPQERSSLMPNKQQRWWSLYSAQNGELLGRIPEEAGIHDLVVLGKRVLYLVPGAINGSLDQPNWQPQILKVIDLQSGKKLWEHPVAGKFLAPPPV